MRNSIRILIGDDQKQARARLRALVERQQRMQVIAEARNGHDVISLARKHSPDIVLMDVTMPELDGLQALERIMQDGLRTQVIVVSGRTSRVWVMEAQRLGAKGYVAKQDLADDLIPAIEAVINGAWYVSRLLQQDYHKVPALSMDGGSHDARKQQAGVHKPDLVNRVRIQSEVSQKGSTQHRENKLRILLLDDEPMVRDHAALILPEKSSQIELISYTQKIIEKADENTALQIVAQEQPDVILLDLMWQDGKQSGWPMLKHLRNSHPHIPVIVFSNSSKRIHVNEAVEMGARGYVAKIDWVDHLIIAILEVHEGKTYYSPSVPRPENRPIVWLSDEEIKVFKAYVSGLTPVEIARKLGYVDKSGKVDNNVYVHIHNMKYYIGHPEGWKGVQNDNTEEWKELLDALDTLERQVFDQHVGGMTRTDEMAKALKVPEIDVKGCMRTVQCKLVPIKKSGKHSPRPILGCHPEGWKGIAKDLQLID